MQLVPLLVVLIDALVKPLGWFMARVFEGAGTAPLGLSAALGWLERATYRLCGVHFNPDGTAAEMPWKLYTVGILIFNIIGFAAVYGLQRLQHLLPANPAGLGPVEAGSAFNTAISFVSNTNWQGYGGEVTMSSLTQMLGLGVQNFLSWRRPVSRSSSRRIRGLSRKNAGTIGNCWADLTRATFYVLLPLAVLAPALSARA